MAPRGARRESFQEKRDRHRAIDDPEIVLNAAARFLEARSRSVDEVRRRLTGAGYRADLVEAAIARLVDLHMLDDETFARAWVESRDRARPRGELALRRELALKGIDRDTAAQVLVERREGADDGRGEDEPSADEEAARRLLARRASALMRVNDVRVRRQRAYALLARNGFDPEVCRRASASVADLGDEGEPDEDPDAAPPVGGESPPWPRGRGRKPGGGRADRPSPAPRTTLARDSTGTARESPS